MNLKMHQLAGSLKKGLAPVYLIAGEEPLWLQECCDQVRAAARTQGFEEREVLYAGTGFDWEELQQAAAPSLFGSRKVIDLRLRTGKPGREGGEALMDWAEAPNPDMVLLVSCEQWDKSSRGAKWANALGKAGVRVDIWPIKARELPGWLEQRMQSRGLQPDREALRILAERLEGNLLAAAQEVDRLALLKGPGPITAGDVLQAVADASRFNAFVLAEHMLAGNLRDGLRVAAGLKRSGEPIQPLVGALLRELKTTEAFRLAMRSGESADSAYKRLGIWFGRKQVISAAARRLDTRALYEAFEMLALIDRQGKGQSEGDAWQTVDQLLLRLAA